MSWFFLTLLASALFGITNHIDKYLISRYFHGNNGPGALIIFSTLVGILVIPFVLVIEQGVFGVSFFQAGVLIAQGIFFIIAVLLYFYALKEDETSVVAPLFLLIPVFAFLIAFAVLGESLATPQLVGGLSIIAGSIVISLSMEKNKVRLKKRVLFLMSVASFLIAVGALLFKMIAVETGFWVATFWSYVGYLVLAGFISLFIRSYREQFMSIIRANRVPIIGLNVLNELISVGASLAVSFALLLAPIALVQAVGGLQPAFVLLYGVVLTLFFPKLGMESLARKDIIQRIIAILIMGAGVYLVNIS
jgi:uncharacterized membrane protein